MPARVKGPTDHVVIVGAGPVGLTLAIDLAQRGQNVVLLNKGKLTASGSKAICFSKRSLEIFDRLGCGQRMVDKGVSWNVGKVFLKDKPLKLVQIPSWLFNKCWLTEIMPNKAINLVLEFWL